MTLIEGNSLFHGFAHDVRSLFATVSDLQVMKSWDGRSPSVSDDEPLPPIGITPSLRGVAVLKKHSVTVIGESTRTVERLDFSLGAFDDWEALTNEWRRARAAWGDPARFYRPSESVKADPSEVDRLLKYVGNVFAAFEKHPPTINLSFHKADWEIGNRDSWLLSCRAPRVVVDALASDISEGRQVSLSLAFELVPSLSDSQYAPASASVTLGILPTAGGSGFARGWVHYLTWNSSTASAPLPVNHSQTELVERARPSADGFLGTVANDTRPSDLANAMLEVAKLSATVRSGFILVLILLALVVVLK